MSWSADVRRVFRGLTEEAAEKGVRKIALTAYGTLVKTTPVDTGRARNGWQMTTGKPSAAVSESRGKAYSAPEAIPDASRSAKVGQTIYIVNNVEYIGFLDEGTSDQAPAGMTSIMLSQLDAVFK